MKERCVLVPDYYKNFTCDIKECEDTCCKGTWNIMVNESAYKKLKKVKDRELTELISRGIKRNRKNPSQEEYGTILHDPETKGCYFQNDEGLCSLQLKLGSDYLCDVCMVYPRSSNSIGPDSLEKSLTLSCPVVARLVLLNGNRMEFEYLEESNTGRTAHVNSLAKRHYLGDHFWEARKFCIGILQNRKYTMDERMIALGIFTKKLDVLSGEGSLPSIPGFIEAMKMEMETDAFCKSVRDIGVTSELQAVVAESFLNSFRESAVKSEKYRDIIDEVLKSLMPEDGCSDVLKEKYGEMYARYTKPYMAEKEYILENMTVNEYFRLLMPISFFDSAWEAYEYLCMIYSLVKIQITGVSASRGYIDDKLAVDVIYLFSKEIIHNRMLGKFIIDTLNDNKFNSLAHMTVLLKN